MALLPEQSFALMSKYNLTAAPTKSLGLCASFDQLCDMIRVAHGEAVTGKVAKVQEGVNIWLIKRNDKVHGDRILSISRVECIEFTILNEMRHLLKQYCRTIEKGVKENAMQTDSIKQKFIKDIRTWGDQFKDKLPHSLDFYFELLICSFSKLGERVAKGNYELRDQKALLLHYLDTDFFEFLQAIQAT